MDISIVIPTYNEEENVIKLYQELVPVLVRLKKKFEIIYIDDGSTDRTFELLQGLAEKDSAVRVIKFAGNFGQTAAMKAGFDYAQGDVVMSMDADLQNDPADIPKLLEKLSQNYDVVCGWRADRHDPIGKKVASTLSNWFRRRIVDVDIHDSGCTLRAYRKKAIKNLIIYGEKHRFIPLILAAKGFKIGEAKVNHRERMAGKTKYGSTRILKGLLDLITVKFITKYGARPIHVFGSIGLLSAFLGFISGAYLTYLKLFKGAAIANRPLLFLTLLLVIMGVQFLLIGFVAELIVQTNKRAKDSYTVENVLNK